MMQFTHNIEVLHRLAVKNCPKTFIDENDYAVLYVQDVTTGTDYYIFSYDRWTCEFWALTDPLRDMYFLDFEFIHITELKDHLLFYKLYKKSQRPYYEQIYIQIAVMKALS